MGLCTADVGIGQLKNVLTMRMLLILVGHYNWYTRARVPLTCQFLDLLLKIYYSTILRWFL
jgi:hypothetical protein